MKLGLNNVSNIALGSSPVNKIYLGSTKVYDRAPTFTHMIDAVSNTRMTNYIGSASVTEQFNGYSGYPYLKFDSVNDTLNTFFETPVSTSSFNPNNWSMEIVFRPRKNNSASSWVLGTTVAGFGTAVGGERISCDVYSNQAAMWESNGYTGGGGMLGTLNPNDWYYLKTYEITDWVNTVMYLRNLTTGVTVTNTGMNYAYYYNVPTRVVMGGNPTYSGYRHLDVDIAMVRIRSNASSGIPTMPFVMPTAADKTASDVFFMIGS